SASVRRQACAELFADYAAISTRSTASCSRGSAPDSTFGPGSTCPGRHRVDPGPKVEEVGSGGSGGGAEVVAAELDDGLGRGRAQPRAAGVEDLGHAGRVPIDERAADRVRRGGGEPGRAQPGE